MLVLCYGIPKSGSTLAFVLVKGILESAGFEQPFVFNDRLEPEKIDPDRSNNFVVEISEQAVDTLIAQIGPNRMIAVKTHAPFPDALFPFLEDLQARRVLQVVASYRDPRDTCLSLMDAGEKARGKGVDNLFAKVGDLERAARKVKRHIRTFRKWAALRGTLRLNYETVAFSPDDAIAAIEKTLGVTGDAARVKQFAFEEARTQKNKARKKRYLDELSDEKRDELTRFFDEFIRRACERDDSLWYEERREEILSETF